MIWYVIGALLWIVLLLLVISVFRMENARNSHRAMELEKRFTDLRNSLRLIREAGGERKSRPEREREQEKDVFAPPKGSVEN
jgi:hypothetical protein